MTTNKINKPFHFHYRVCYLTNRSTVPKNVSNTLLEKKSIRMFFYKVCHCTYVHYRLHPVHIFYMINPLATCNTVNLELNLLKTSLFKYRKTFLQKSCLFLIVAGVLWRNDCMDIVRTSFVFKWLILYMMSHHMEKCKCYRISFQTILHIIVCNIFCL